MKRKISAASKAIRDKIRAALTGRPDAITSAQLRQATKFKGKPPEFMRQILTMRRDGELLQHEGDTPRSSRYSLNVDKLPDLPVKVAKKSAGKISKLTAKQLRDMVRLSPAEREMLTNPALPIAEALAELRTRRARIDAAIGALQAL